jgi:hypothetical protein
MNWTRTDAAMFGPARSIQAAFALTATDGTAIDTAAIPGQLDMFGLISPDAS